MDRSVATVQLICVRHALPASGEDPGLVDRGREQARRLVDALAHDEVDAVYTSPMRRARETAGPLCAERALEPVVLAGLAEFEAELPAHRYRPVEELAAERAPLWEAFRRGELAPGVDPAAFRGRVVSAVERVVTAHPGGTAVLVSHSGALNAWCGHVLGQTRPLFFAPDYVSVSRVGAARDGRRGVVSLNETAHVRDLLVR